MISLEIQQRIDYAREMIRQAQHLVVFTGAGISTPSGIPDFRSKGSGLWEQYDPMEVASLTTFRNHPERFWEWKRPLMLKIWDAQPNPAHQALARLEKTGKVRAVITQNIDGLHQRAGSQNVLELHGSIETMSCPRCARRYPSLQFRPILEQGQGIPHCPVCQQVLKPDVVLFEEMLPRGTWHAAEEHCAQADVILVAGSSLEVWPAAQLPEMALSHGAKLILVNLSPTYLDTRAEALIPLDVSEAIPQLTQL